ncbi:thioredoxin family protein [Thiothrix subterranea]|uniref:Thioredoxin fold domain-containing protein n=1 Tax=Thiothrix subterranea TaxID=2735563 RepID=A0AA51MU18_9GAMM|nr:thioredoxin fold domain-containing protein [Thiothrix subterranea]MDQ5769076.1 thioredoxin fold domain-containing protein [Thiothrix subterranea]WML88366.1 thioredoxin fold domain-containing protein [Thiothrix subterranea]
MHTNPTFITNWLFALALWVTSLAPTAIGAEAIPEANDFQALQQEMQRKGIPLLLAVRADYCGFCRQLETEHLEPMLRSGQYDARILIRRFDLGSEQTVVDFNGERIDADEFAARHQASLTPTLLFLDAEGKEVAERLLGYNSPDFYGAYLEDAITTAQRALN